MTYIRESSTSTFRLFNIFIQFLFDIYVSHNFNIYILSNFNIEVSIFPFLIFMKR